MKKLLISIFLISLLFLPSSAYADIGPAPPMMDFHLEYRIHKTPIVNIEVYVCEDSDCLDKEMIVDPPEWYGRPLRIDCVEDNCWVFEGSQSFKRYHILVITFSDTTRVSNVFTKTTYGANYEVIVNEDSLHIREVLPDSIFDIFSPFQNCIFLPALALTLISETKVANCYSRRIRYKIRWVVYANLISLPVVWFIFPFIRINYILLILLAESFAITFEAVFLYLANRKLGASFKHASIASIFMNVASVGVGVVTILVISGVMSILTRSLY